MTDFKDKWDRMTVVERIAHIQADWAKCRETDEPMVLRIASAVAHDVCRQAADEIERLRKERDEARQLYCDYAIQNSRAYRLVGIDTLRCLTPQAVAEKMGWDCFKEAP